MPEDAECLALGNMFKRSLPVLAVVFIIIISDPAVLAQSNGAEGPEVPGRSYQLLREDEDWSFLRDRSLRRAFWDPVKFVPLRNDGEWYMTIGGAGTESWEKN